jgi:hypothetical protein
MESEILFNNYPEAKELPDSFLQNIYKIGLEQNRLSDEKWLKKMLLNAIKKYESQSKNKKEKVKKENTETKVVKNEMKEKKVNFSKEHKERKNYRDEYKELVNKLPFIDNKGLYKLFPRVKISAIVYIKLNYGLYTLRLLSILEDKNKIYTGFSIKFCSTIAKDFRVKNIIEPGLHMNHNLLYETVTQHKNYANKEEEILKYISWRKENFAEKNKVNKKTHVELE